MRIVPRSCVILAAGLFLGTSTFPSHALSGSEPDLVWAVEDPGGRAEIHLQDESAKLRVRLIHQSYLELPDFVEISLLAPNGKRLNLELSAVPPETLSPEAKLYRDYTGTVPQTLESYVGIAVRFPLGWSETRPLFEQEK